MLEVAQAVWPAYPDTRPVVNVEPLTPWLAHIDRYCELVADGRRYLMNHLVGRSPAAAIRLAHRYIEAWAVGAEAEPQLPCKANTDR